MGSLNPDFTDETVVVTGAASGSSREASLRFGETGADVGGDPAPEPKDVDVPTHEPSEGASDVTGELVTIDGGWSVF